MGELKNTKGIIDSSAKTFQRSIQDRREKLDIQNVIEDAIRKSEERFRVMAEMLPVVVYETDEKGIIRYVNKQGVEVSGYTEEDFNNGVHASMMLAEQDRPRIGEIFKEILQGKSFGMREFKAQRKSGEIFPVIARSAPIYTDGKVVGIRGIVVDISDLKHTQQALETSEKKFQAQYKAIPVPTFTWKRQDDDFILIDYNDAAFRVTEGGIEKYLETKASEMYGESPEILEDLQKCYREQKNHSREMHYKYMTTGAERHMIANYAFAPPDYVMVHTVDNTESKKAELFFQNASEEMEKRVKERTAALEKVNRELILQIHEKEKAQDALRQREQSYRTLYETAPDGILNVDTFGYILDCNQTYCEMLGYNKNELIGRNMQELFLDFSLKEKEFLSQISKTGTAEAEAEAIRKDGSKLPLWGKSTLIYDDEGKLETILIYCRDISIRKEMEKDLSSKAHEVELYNDILTHDLNNINQTTLNYVNLLISEDYGRINEDQKTFLLTCRSQIDRCTSLIEKIKTLSRLHMDSSKELTRVNIGHIIGRMVQNLRESYKEKHITVDFNPPKNVMVRANHLVHQLIYNLLENAVKHSRGREVYLKIAIAEGKTVEFPTYRIAFEDLGPGIRDDIKPKIFNRFESSREHKGSGLGLAIVKALANYFHGTVEVEDRIKGDSNQGSRFIVTLPKA